MILYWLLWSLTPLAFPPTPLDDPFLPHTCPSTSKAGRTPAGERGSCSPLCANRVSKVETLGEQPPADAVLFLV